MLNVKKFLSFIRTITTYNQNFAANSLPTSTLLLNSCSESYPNDRIYLSNRRIDNLINSLGDLNSALNLFYEMPFRDVVSFNLMISGYARYGLREQAFKLYSQMVMEGFRESGSTFSSVLSICSDAELFREGIQVHCRVVFFGFSSNLFVGSSIIDLYMRMGLDKFAMKVFDEMPEKNLAVWNLTLRGFCELGLLDAMLRLYSKMKLEDLTQNGLTFCYLIRGCGNGRFIEEGRQLHCQALKVGLTESNIFVTNCLVDFYSNCRRLIDAKRAFDCIHVKDVISWNSIVAVFADNGCFLESLELLSRMQFWGKRPSIRSLMAFLNLSSQIRNIHFGQQVHSYALKLGFDNQSSHIQSGLINMYGKCKEIDSSIAIYKTISVKTLECCNSLMTSLLHCGLIEDVVEMFHLLLDQRIGFDEITLSTTLKALSLSTSTSLSSCKSIHSCAMKSGFESNVSVSSSLMEAYSRTGHIELSRHIFEEISSPNVICYTSIINGYARNGNGKECLEMLYIMIEKGLIPDKVTFLCALNGCNHSGLVDEGKFVFELMRKWYGFHPDHEHYSCLIDLLGRAGLLNEAEELVQKEPEKDDWVIWTSILRSCRIHGNVLMGRRAVKKLIDLELDNPAIYLQASNFYSEIGDFKTSEKLREPAMDKKGWREIGHSLVEVETTC